MSTIRPEDVVDIVGITTFTLAAATIMLMVVKADTKVLPGKKGWIIIATTFLLFAVRSYGHFAEEEWFQFLRRSIGIVNSVLLPLGLATLYRHAQREDT